MNTTGQGKVSGITVGYLYAEDHKELFSYLMEVYCLRLEDMLFVNNIADWCRKQGIPEPDHERPLKLVLNSPQGCRMLISRMMPKKTVEQHINGLSIRSQIKGITDDPADRLNSDRKKLAYLFLAEYAASLPEMGEDELLADAWALKEMERLGFFNV